MKFKPSQVVKDRQTGKLTTQHFYMKSTSTKELLEALEKSNTQPKLKQKVRNELVRRKVTHA
tara:strand:+ start:4234 stop:4419 length:186 start_codon:yes stop_codon:yes gene_type:complete